uniref:Uncharacterized protein n=1 Tax=Triticum urartu TaxID=4572 RepID=A0A8R7VD85_TRIUA
PRARSAGSSRGSTGARTAPASPAASPACRPTSAAPPGSASAPAPSPSSSPSSTATSSSPVKDSSLDLQSSPSLAVASIHAEEAMAPMQIDMTELEILGMILSALSDAKIPEKECLLPLVSKLLGYCIVAASTTVELLQAHDNYGNWRQIPAFTGTCLKKCL